MRMNGLIGFGGRLCPITIALIFAGREPCGATRAREAENGSGGETFAPPDS
jgi:hypothetical protein